MIAFAPRLTALRTLPLVALFALSPACRSAPAPAAPPATAATAATPAVAAAATKPAGPPPLPELAYAAGPAPRRSVAMVLTIAAPQAIAADLDNLGKTLAIPMPLGEAFLMALADEDASRTGLRISRAAVDRLDPARPIVGVMLAESGSAPHGFCLAVPFRDAAAARGNLGGLGIEIGRVGSESVRRLQSGKTLHAALHGRTLLISETSGLSAIAGPLLEELQAKPPVSAAALTVYPAALLPVHGPLLAQVAETAIAAALPPQGTDDELTPALRRLIVGAARLAAQPIDETRAATVSLDLNARAGLALGLTVEPTPGTALARHTAAPTPFQVSEKLPIPGDDGFIVAWGTLATMASVLGDVAATSGAKGVTFQRNLTALFALTAGQGSCVASIATLPMRSTCVWSLVPGAKPATVLTRYAEMMKSSYAWANELTTEADPGKLKIRKSGAILEIQEPVAMPGDTPAARAGREALFGGSLRTSAVTVRDGQLLIAQGPKPRALLTELERPSARPRPAAPLVSALLGRSNGADLIAYVDLLSFIVRVMESTADPTVRQAATMVNAIPGLRALRAPLLLTGKTAEGKARYELQLPFESLSNIAAVVRPFMGAMGGGK